MAESKGASVWLQALAALALLSLAFTLLVPSLWFLGAITFFATFGRAGERLLAAQQAGAAEQQLAVGLFLAGFLVVLTQGGWLLRGLFGRQPGLKTFGGTAALLGLAAGVATLLASGVKETGSAFGVAGALWLTACAVHLAGWLGVVILRLVWRASRASDLVAALVLTTALTTAGCWWLFGKAVEAAAAGLRASAVEQRRALSLAPAERGRVPDSLAPPDSLGGLGLGSGPRLPREPVEALSADHPERWFDACVREYEARLKDRLTRQARNCVGEVDADDVLQASILAVCTRAGGRPRDLEPYFVQTVSYACARWKAGESRRCPLPDDESLPGCPLPEDTYADVLFTHTLVCDLDQPEQRFVEDLARGYTAVEAGRRGERPLGEAAAKKKKTRLMALLQAKARNLCLDVPD